MHGHEHPLQTLTQLQSGRGDLRTPAGQECREAGMEAVGRNEQKKLSRPYDQKNRIMQAQVCVLEGLRERNES